MLPMVKHPYPGIPMFNYRPSKPLTRGDFQTTTSKFPITNSPKKYPQLAASEQKFIATKMAYEYNNDHDASARSLKEALAFNPDESVYLFNYAAIQMRNGRYDETIAALNFLTKRGLEARSLAAIGPLLPGSDLCRTTSGRKFN